MMNVNLFAWESPPRTVSQARVFGSIEQNANGCWPISVAKVILKLSTLIGS